MSNTNWCIEISKEMENQGEKWSDLESSTLSLEELLAYFNSGYGGSEGKPFTVWTIDRVYFPVVYDGSEWVESVSRNPNGKPSGHFGGG